MSKRLNDLLARGHGPATTQKPPTNDPKTLSEVKGFENYDKVLDEIHKERLNEQLETSAKIVKLLREKFECSKPLVVIMMIKRKIKSGRAHEITAKKIREWGR